MNEFDMNAIYDEIHDAMQVRNKQPGEFTAKEYAAHHGMTVSWAHTELKRAIEAGKVSSRKTTVDKHIAALYKIITES